MEAKKPENKEGMRIVRKMWAQESGRMLPWSFLQLVLAVALFVWALMENELTWWRIALYTALILSAVINIVNARWMMKGKKPL